MNNRYLISALFIEVLIGATLIRWTELVAWADDHSGIASWVQAFGSIGAILISVWTSVWSVNRAHRLQAQAETTRTLEVVFQLVGGAALVADKYFVLQKSNGPATPGELVMMGIEFEAFADAIHRLDPSRLDRYEIVEAALVTEMTLRHLKYAVDRVQSETFSHELEPGYLLDLTNTAHQELKARTIKLAKIHEKRATANANDVRPG